jgi:hypothetical protein
LRRSDQLQQLVRVLQPVLEFVLLVAKGGGRELCGDAGFFQARVRGDKTNLVYADARGARQRGFKLFGQFRGLGLAGWESTSETTEFVLVHMGEKLHAG